MTYLVVVLCDRREFPNPYSPAGQNPSPLLCLGASVTPEQILSPSRSKKTKENQQKQLLKGFKLYVLTLDPPGTHDTCLANSVDSGQIIPNLGRWVK